MPGVGLRLLEPFLQSQALAGTVGLEVLGCTPARSVCLPLISLKPPMNTHERRNPDPRLKQPNVEDAPLLRNGLAGLACLLASRAKASSD